MGDSRAVGNLTKIPEHLQPLPNIYKNNLRKHLFGSPKSLVELCCRVLKRFEDENPTEAMTSRATWPAFDLIFSCSAKVMTDSYRSLCHIEHPIGATQFLLRKARALNMTPGAFLRLTQIIRDETSAEMRLDHWERITARARYPRVIFSTN